MRQPLLTFLATLGLALTSAHAQTGDLSDEFLNGYLLFQKGDKLAASGSYSAAQKAYKQAIIIMDRIAATDPAWQPLIVKHRRDQAAEAAERVRPLMGKPGDKPAEADPTDTLPNNNPPNDGPGLIPDELPQRDSGGRQPRNNFQPGPPPDVNGGDNNADPFKAIRERLAALQNDLESTREKLRQVTGEKDELSKKLDGAAEETQKALQMQSKLQTRADRAEDALLKAETDGATSATALKALKAESETAKKQLRDARIEREAAEELRGQNAERSAVIKKRIETLTQERDEARKAGADAPAKLAAIQKQLEKVLADKTLTDTKLAASEENLKTASKDRDEARKEAAGFKDAEKKIGKLLADNATALSKLTEAEKALSDFKGSGTKKEEQAAAFQKEVAAARDQVAAAQKQGADYQQKMVAAQAKNDAQVQEIAQLKSSVTVGESEKKQLTEEGELLRGIVVREIKEQGNRDAARKQVLSQLAKLDVQSKAILKQIDYLGQPVLKLTEKERKLFKKSLIEMSDAEVSISAPKDAPKDAPEAAPEKAPAAAPGTKPQADAKSPSSATVPAEFAEVVREAREQFEGGKYEDAARSYQKILSAVPENLYALSNLGLVQLRDKKLKAAEETFKKALAIAPDNSFNLSTLGVVYYNLERYDEAMTALSKALALEPKNPSAHNYLGMTAIQKGWQDNAQKELDTAVTLDPNYADAHFNLAVIYASQKPPNKEAARKHYTRATELGSAPDPALEKLLK